MRRLGSSFILGIIILVIGASIAINLFFDLAIPVVRSLIAVLLLYWGSRLVASAWSRRDQRLVTGEAWLRDRRFAPTTALDGDAKYDIVFGRGVVDLTHIGDPPEDITVTVDTVFGSSVVKVDPAIAYDVHLSSAFGEIRTPDRKDTSHLAYSAPTDHRPRLHLRLITVFGSCRIVEVVGAA